MTDITIVLLNWNSYPIVLDAAVSALAQQDVSVDLVVVDNGSNDGSLAKMRERYPQLRIIEMGWNSGFTGGMNAGTDAARGEFVLWQNADLLLAEDYCARAVATMRADSTIGAVGGTVYRLVDGQRSTEFDAAGYTLRPTHRARFVTHRRDQDVVGVSGSCPIFRREALDSLRAPVGYILEPWYFAYGEDIDVMLRLNLAGWRVRYIADMVAWHVRSGSTAPASRFYQKPDHIQVHHFKNRVATILKAIPRSAMLTRLPALIATELGMPFYLLLRRPKSIRNWARAWHQLWRERRRLLRDRVAIQEKATSHNVARLQTLLARTD